MVRKQASDTEAAAEAADTSVLVPTAAELTSASVQIEGTDIPNVDEAAAEAADIAPAAPTAAELSQAAIAQIEAALAVLGDSPASAAAAGALTAALETERGNLALAEAEAALQAQKTAEIEAARAAAVNLPAELLNAMLQAIEFRYAPAEPIAPDEQTAAEAMSPASGRKPIGPRTAERNAAALAEASADPSRSLRAANNLTSFRKEWQPFVVGVNPQAGTRYVSMAALTLGVTGKADYQALVPVLRAYMISTGLYKAGGESAAEDSWLFAYGPHAPNAGKSDDTLRLKFSNRAEVALHSDGMFRLTAPNRSDVTYVRLSASALARWQGKDAAMAQQAQAYANSQAAAPAASAATPTVPTPPNAIAQPNGSLAQTARCQHCNMRNIVGMAACNACGAADWQAS